MDLSLIAQTITQLGFPIVMVLGLCLFVSHLWERQSDENAKREHALYECLNTSQEQNEKLSNTNAEFVHVLHEYRADLETIKSDVNSIKEKLN
ncbi:MAG TPA: hypothetical protein H9887_07535 [Candidatus Dorea intestinavium]|nr:hypothetical protein [Candidatus Dorea intestinavium]